MKFLHYAGLKRDNTAVSALLMTQRRILRKQRGLNESVLTSPYNV